MGYSYSEYVVARQPMPIHCLTCGNVFLQTPSSHLSGRGCPHCGRKASAYKRRKSLEKFIADARAVHGDKYNYESVDYVLSTRKVTISCGLHGNFLQTPNNHIRGNGCPTCKNEHSSTRQRFSVESFIVAARTVHGFRYTYDEASYTSLARHVTIKCPDHGEFKQRAQAHLKSGCAACAGNKTSNTSEFIAKARLIHGDNFNYKKVRYVAQDVKVTIVCRSHGAFNQTPNSHLQGTGCAKCTSQISSGETAWLDSLRVPKRQYTIKLPSGKRIRADGYDPTTNTVYAFLGSFWHADPRKCPPEEKHPVTRRLNREIHSETLAQIQEIKAAGFTVVSIWEYDWKRRKKRYRRYH